MPALRKYEIFICHDWEYSQDYYRVKAFLDQAPWFHWEDHSVPEHDPLANDEKLEYELRNQMRPADVMLVLAGMYTARSRWMDWVRPTRVNAPYASSTSGSTSKKSVKWIRVTATSTRSFVGRWC